MIKASYEQLINKISRSSGLGNEEVARRIEAKIAKLSNLISKEGAAQIVAAELGVTFDKQKVKVNELLSGMRNISIVGKILKISPVRTFQTKNAESKVVNLLLGDETGTVRTVLWDTNHIALIEQGKIKEGSVIEIINGSIRGEEMKEIHIGSNGEIKESDVKIENVVTQEASPVKSISKLQENDRAKIRATIVQAFEPKFFEVCPECNIKVSQEDGKSLCAKHGVVMPKERAIFNIVVDDGSESIRAVFFEEALKKLLKCDIPNLKNSEFFLSQKKDLLGEEVFLSGRARKNKLFNTIEFIVQDSEIANVEEVIKQLQK